MANLRRWSSSASGNATVTGGVSTINFAEGQNPGSVNNSAREMMAQIRKVYVPSEWGWVETSATASVVSQTVFKLTGNQTSDWTQGRRWRLNSGSSTRYGKVVSSSYTTETTVTVTVDSGSLSASHAYAAVSAIDGDGNQIPHIRFTAAGRSIFTEAQLLGSDTSTLNILFSDTSADNGKIAYDHSADAMTVYAAGAKQLTIDDTSGIRSNRGAFGYGTGAGSSVTQVGTKAIGVTINSPGGQITTASDTLTAATSVSFTVINSHVTNADLVIAHSQNTNYSIRVNQASTGSFVLNIKNESAGNLSQAVVINFAVFRSSVT